MPIIDDLYDLLRCTSEFNGARNRTETFVRN